MKKKTEIWAGGFVDEGTVVLRDLGLEGMIPPIPDGESAVTALVLARNGNVYGLTCGSRSHLFVYHDAPVEDGVLRLGAIAENAGSGSLACTRRGVLYGIACSSPGEGVSDAETVMFRYDPSADSMSGETSMSVGTPEILPCPFAGKQVADLVIDASRDVLYGLSLPDRVFFSYEVDADHYTELGEIAGAVVSKKLCVTDDGAVYGAAEEGVVFRFDPAGKRLEMTAMQVPCGKGKAYVNEVSAWSFDARTRTIYGGTLNDGFLFKLALEDQRVICLGKPIEQRPIRCLTVGRDGLVYGVAGEPKAGICHLFRYDPDSGDLRDLGIPRATITQSWVAHEIDAICCGRNGSIIMGENDRISHLMIYYPPVRDRPRG